MLPHLKMGWSNLGEVEIISDASITPGGCRVLAGHGEIDADLQSQLDRIVTAA